jgi:ketopantoate hydroxymethyltransferase
VQAGAAAVKVEGGLPIVGAVRRMVEVGIPVMGHLGSSPSRCTRWAGYAARPCSARRTSMPWSKKRTRSRSVARSQVVLEAVGAEAGEA